MNFLEENIRKIAEESASKYGFFLIDVIVRGTARNPVIEIYVDGEGIVSVDDCAKISRDINTKIEETDLKESDYRLDVSSPGVERPLKFLKQYTKHLNRKFEITYKLNNIKTRLTGQLINIEGDKLFFIDSKTKKETIINFNDILKANVLISFS